jgi:hypothetical protein
MRFVFCVLAAACSQHAAPATVSLALPLPTAPITPVSEKRDPTWPRELELESDRGKVHLVKDRDGFAGTYPDGVLTCTIRAETLTCHWYQHSNEGIATLQRKGDRLEGDWDGEVADDETLPTPRGTVNAALDGAWDSNWSSATITSNTRGVHVDYADGSIDCTVHDRKLSCTWQETTVGGGAEFVIETERVLRGRWGTGSSATDGGNWVFVRR